MRTRVKICGITRSQDAQLVVDAGVDAIGLVFYEKSPRFVSIEQAIKIRKMIPAFVSCVALFKDENPQQIEAVLAQIEVDLLQFHGSEKADFCEQFKRPYIKALGMKSTGHDENYLLNCAEEYQLSKALLLDGHAPGDAGGTGEKFDWSCIQQVQTPIVLAGGLTPGNVKQAIDTAHPFAVDVSSGVESEPGCKDKTKVTAFMRAVYG